MEQWFKKNWYWVLAGIIGLIFLIVIYRAIKKSGEKPHQQKAGEDVVGSDIPQQDIEILEALAENLHEDIHCNFCFRDSDLYDELSALSNNYLVGVSNIYNHYYELDDDETFYQALKNEYYTFGTAGKVDAILDRLRSLGVS